MRKKFVSKWLRINPLEYLAERNRPASKQGSWMVDRQLKASAGLESLMHGNASREHINDIVASHNMATALQKYKTGDEYRSITNASADALCAITDRFGELGRYVAKGNEIKALQDLLELHDAQLEVCTVGQIQEAYEYALKVHNARRLNSKFIQESA
jgi:hypothetical protein